MDHPTLACSSDRNAALTEHSLATGLSIVVPVFNSARALPELVAALQAALPQVGERYEVLLVNDGSSDESWNVIQGLARESSWVSGINLMRNYGQHNATLCGIRMARYDVCVTMDDDLQHPPNEIVQLTNRLAEGYDVVYGSPHDDQHDFWRSVASRLIKFSLKKAMRVDAARDVSAFRAFRTDLRRAFGNYQSPYLCIDVLLSWSTTRFSSVLVQHNTRRYGASNYTFRRLMLHALNMITGFSSLPLRLVSVMGFCVTLFGLGVLTYVLGRYFLFGTTVPGFQPGFTFLACSIAIFSGAQLVALGIIGEYLGRMHFRLMERPTYSIRECTTGGEFSIADF